ncbi:NAD(P)/FAD-dependent oxidoreductase [Marinactinospora rubrisoli]|uniref:NAD(P)/FAD-dependent oxidoreductase n=1 Tax=Marinactinospora rubrisoli TaxID=2715399 RepID=A0ABW2KNW9_9ACTN
MRVIVVGGGIVGASAAYHLTRRGVPTTLVEAERPGRATDAGAGIVFPWPLPGTDPAAHAFMMAAARHYPRLAAELAEDVGGPIGYTVVGGMTVGADETAVQRDLEALRALAARPGCGEVGEPEPLPVGEPARRFPALRPEYSGVAVGGTARVNGRLLRGTLLRAAEERALRFRAGAAELVGDGTRVTGVRVGGEVLPADAVVLAAGAWSAALLAPFGVRLPLRPVRGQIVHLALPGHSTGRWPVVRFAGRDHYLLAFPANLVVVGATREPEAGFDHRVTAGGLHRVLADALEVAPGLAEGTVLETRVGFRPASEDGLPILGVPANLPGVVVATGLGASGLTYGPYQGALAADLATGRPCEVDVAAFRPDR